MIHLFNEVFIEQVSKITIYPIYENAKLKENLYSVCVISEEYNTNDLKSNSAVLLSSNNLQDLLKENKWSSLEDFLRFLFLFDRKLVIYADNEVVAKIVTTTFKSLTYMEYPQFKTWVGIYKWRSITNSKQYGNLYDLMLDEFEKSPSYNFSDVDYIPSYEFCIASAFVDPDFPKKDKLISLMSKFIKREYEDVILETRKHIDNLILDIDVQRMLGSNQFITNINIDKIKAHFPKLGIYKEPYYVEKIYGPTHKSYRPGSFARGETKLNIALCTEEELDDLCKLTDTIIHKLTGEKEYTKEQACNLFESRDWRYVKSVTSGDRTLTYEEYLDALNEMINEKYTTTHVPLDLREFILFQIIPYFKTLKRLDRIDELRKFTLK